MKKIATIITRLCIFVNEYIKKELQDDACSSFEFVWINQRLPDGERARMRMAGAMQNKGSMYRASVQGPSR